MNLHLHFFRSEFRDESTFQPFSLVVERKNTFERKSKFEVETLSILMS